MAPNRRRLFLLAGSLLAAGAFGLVIYTLGAVRNAGSSQAALGRSTPVPSAQAESFERLKAAAQGPIELTLEGAFPRGVIGKVAVAGNSPTELARNYLHEYQDFYLQRDPDLELHLLRSSSDTVVFYQTYRGVRVYGGELAVLTDGGSVVGTAGSLLTAGTELEVTPSLPPRAALDVAADQLGLDDHAIAGQPRLVVFDSAIAGLDGNTLALAWQVNLQTPRALQTIVDANSGEVLLSFDLTQGHRDPYELDIYLLLGTSIEDSGCNSLFPGFHLGNEMHLFDVANAPPDALNALSHSGSTWDYFHDVHGFHSYDNDGEPLWVYVHSTTDKGAAFWSCDLFEFGIGNVVADVFAHEFTHGVDSNNANLTYAYQSGALEESFADVMAAMVDGNWTIGEWAATGAIRDLSNPDTFGDPDHMSEYQMILDCADPSNPLENDNGCVHTNSGIPNYVAYLLAEGGIHPDSKVEVQSLGYGPVEWLYFNVLVSGLTSNAQFIDSRNMSVGYALAVWGTEGACRVRNAWFAVGIGDPDLDCDGQVDSPTDSDGDLVPDEIDNCPSVFNPVQLDSDSDGFGDLCDLPDLDVDDNGVPDAQETKLADPFFLCPTPGTWCDTSDYDNDGISNGPDNCTFTPNEDQADVDNDGQGDACDPDSDGDGISDNNDNCINTANSDQANADGDLAGDVCDPNPTCDDVYAWSAGSTLELGNETVEVPPEPVADPFACPPNVFVDDENWMDQKPEIDSNGEIHHIRLVWEDEPSKVIPVPVCLPQQPDESPSLVRQIIELASEAEGMTAWVINDLGQVVSKDRDASTSANLPFVPRGGDSYYLVVGQPEASEGGSLTFDLMIRCVEKAPREPKPPPQIGEDIDHRWTVSPTVTRSPGTPVSTATPRVTDAPASTATPTPRYTSTPEPSDTPRVEPTATATPVRRAPTPTPTGRSGG